MLSGLPLVLAALLSAPSGAPISTPEVSGVCDEANVDGDDVAAATLPDGDAALTQLASCSEPPPVPAVVDCNDRRMSVWVQEMIGTCDMPRSTSTLGGPARPTRERPSALCSGAGCNHDSSPLRAATRDADPSQSISTYALRLRVVLEASPLGSRSATRPRSALLARLERPPRA